MATTVKRKGKGIRRATAAQSRAAKARSARRQGQGALGGALAHLPLTERHWSAIFTTLIFLAAAILLWIVASVAGVPAMAQAQFAQLADSAGFAVRHVRVTGVERMNELQVYEIAFDEREQPMPSVDLAALRERLVALPWVKDARVSRQLPDTLAIDIVERSPHAILATDDRLMLIDREGTLLEPISAERAAGMLTVAGPGAPSQVARLSELIDAAPALRPRIVRAEWVGNRRWDITFGTGQKLALPQGEDEAEIALMNFARMDGQNRLLGGKVASFDMRLPDRVYLRVPDRVQDVSDTER